MFCEMPLFNNLVNIIREYCEFPRLIDLEFKQKTTSLAIAMEKSVDFNVYKYKNVLGHWNLVSIYPPRTLGFTADWSGFRKRRGGKRKRT